jgi:hypothetical protein
LLVAGRVRDRAFPEAAPPEPALDDPPVDPAAVRQAYLLARARRRAREQHERATRHASIRFWLVLLVLLAASVAIAVTFWREVQQLFGL